MMTEYIRKYENPRFAFEKEEALRTIEQFETNTSVKDGIVRWNSNNQVPPLDILDLWKHVGKKFDYEASNKARAVETETFLNEYRKRRTARRPSNEELFELRAAHGRGQTTINVITGRKTKT